MSERKMVQMPDELKNQLEAMKAKDYNCKTVADVIQKLLDHYNKTVIELPKELKDDVTELKDHLRIGSEVDTLRLLLNHYTHTPTFSRETFEYAMSLRRY